MAIGYVPDSVCLDGPQRRVQAPSHRPLHPWELEGYGPPAGRCLLTLARAYPLSGPVLGVLCIDMMHCHINFVGRDYSFRDEEIVVEKD